MKPPNSQLCQNRYHFKINVFLAARACRMSFRLSKLARVGLFVSCYCWLEVALHLVPFFPQDVADRPIQDALEPLLRRRRCVTGVSRVLLVPEQVVVVEPKVSRPKRRHRRQVRPRPRRLQRPDEVAQSSVRRGVGEVHERHPPFRRRRQDAVERGREGRGSRFVGCFEPFRRSICRRRRRLSRVVSSISALLILMLGLRK